MHKARERPPGSYFYGENLEKRRLMEPTVVVALISGSVSLAVCMINSYLQTRNIREQNHKTVELIDYKLTKLEETVNKHNKVVDRTYRLEEQTRIHEEKLKVANHRIEDLEKEKTQ